MADHTFDWTDSAIIGDFITVGLLAKLVDKGIMSPADALDVIDDVLLQFEEWQSLFPEQGPYFESARKFLEESITGYQAMLKKQPD
jgi:hypothetical protein